MAGQQGTGGGKKNRKYGRNVAKCKRYRDHQTREKNKIKRMLKSNGLAYAKKWAYENQAETLLARFIN